MMSDQTRSGFASQKADDRINLSPMSGTARLWFHCGSCGALFQGRGGDVGIRLCPKCGQDPSATFSASSLVAQSAEADDPQGDVTESGVARKIRKRRRSRLMAKLLIGWVMFVLLIVMVARHLWHREESRFADDYRGEREEQRFSDKEMKVIEKALPECAAVMNHYINAQTPEERNQFVIHPVQTASRMAAFYRNNPMLKLEEHAKFNLDDYGIIHDDGRDVIETLWSTEDGRKFDAIFATEDGEWRLDWEHFARYSTHPWPLFLAGTGPSQGEFRLYARERLAQERSKEETMSIYLYAPRSGYPDKAGYQSPEFLIARDSPQGKMLAAGFSAMRMNKRPFGSRLPIAYPDDMIRVRLTVVRREVDREPQFEIADVAACHWHSSDQPGLDPVTIQVAPSDEQPAPIDQPKVQDSPVAD